MHYAHKLTSTRRALEKENTLKALVWSRELPATLQIPTGPLVKESHGTLSQSVSESFIGAGSVLLHHAWCVSSPFFLFPFAPGVTPKTNWQWRCPQLWKLTSSMSAKKTAHKAALKLHAHSLYYAHKLTQAGALLNNPVALKSLVWSRGGLSPLKSSLVFLFS